MGLVFDAWFVYSGAKHQGENGCGWIDGWMDGLDRTVQFPFPCHVLLLLK